MNKEFILEKEVSALIKNGYAQQVAESIRNYKVSLDMDKAIELVSYENSLNELISSTTIKINEGHELFRGTSGTEKDSIVDNAKKELEAIELLKAHNSKN